MRHYGTLILPQLEGPPLNPVVGQVYVNVLDGQLYVFDGLDWSQASLPIFVQGTAPTNPPARYLWIQTGLGDGTDLTFWVDDGTP